MTIIADKPKSAVRTGYGILNRYGQFWSKELHETPEEARQYFDQFWKSPGFDKPPRFEDYRLVKVRQTLTYIADIQ